MYKLFQEGGDDSGCGPIFKESTKDAQDQVAGFTYLEIPPASTKHLSGIGYGTVHATTIYNKYWGISANRSIAINVIIVDSNCGIGGTTDFHNYGVLVGDIATTMADEGNNSKVQALLNDFFLYP